MARLDSLSPLAVLARGYALVRRARDGEIVREGGQVNTGESLSIRVAGAQIEASVESIETLELPESLPSAGQTPSPGR